jgi:hypothetical protein
MVWWVEGSKVESRNGKRFNYFHTTGLGVASVFGEGYSSISLREHMRFPAI